MADEDQELREADVIALFRELRALPDGDPRRESIRERLVRHHLGLVRNLARKYRYHAEPMDDLVQVGTLGLINAIDRFDPDHGTGFLGYAVPTITGELRRHFRDAGWSVRVPRRLKDLHGRLATAREELTARLNRAPRPSELADHLGISREEVHEGLLAERGQYGTSLDSLMEDAPHVAFGTADENLDQAELRALLEPMVRELPERSRKIVLLRFGFGLSQADIARRVGVSQMQVSRLLASTLRELRARLGEEGRAVR
ncbi:SigB/SigF/SigG family RNA polymerase sigma factor [Amycolatopsis arida]|uniref:SigB/SigF/SigG family RNA polymerase sigma factor n=1 Tax=Amycolatopsis arida TaxID=587909 RepID=UPI000B843E96|nr:SigB/SigF/SigG family RNA polymerase sigma factor [Amycolatopsis arida]